MNVDFGQFGPQLSDLFFEKGRIWIYTAQNLPFEVAHELTPLAMSRRGVAVAQQKTREQHGPSFQEFSFQPQEGTLISMQIEIDDIPLSDARIVGRIAKINEAPDRTEIGILFEDGE